MASKDIPIKKKQVKDLLKGLPWSEKLAVLEPLADHCRKMSRKEVYSKNVVKKIDEYPV